MFGRGTSGEGCDVTSLRLPGAQEDLLLALADTGTPVIAVLVTGGRTRSGAVADRLAGIVQAFFPGEEGGRAIAGVLSGRIVPSGKLPVEMPGPDAPCRRPTSGPGSPARTAEARWIRRRCSRSGTACRTPALATMTSPCPGPRAHRWQGGNRLHSPQHRVAGGRRGSAALPQRPGGVGARPLRWLAGFVRVTLRARRGTPGAVRSACRSGRVLWPVRSAGRRAWRDLRRASAARRTVCH
jgi:hypothetical protein